MNIHVKFAQQAMEAYFCCSESPATLLAWLIISFEWLTTCFTWCNIAGICWTRDPNASRAIRFCINNACDAIVNACVKLRMCVTLVYNNKQWRIFRGRRAYSASWDTWYMPIRTNSVSTVCLSKLDSAAYNFIIKLCNTWLCKWNVICFSMLPMLYIYRRYLINLLYINWFIRIGV